MIEYIDFDVGRPDKSSRYAIAQWRSPGTKVMVLRPSQTPADVRSFYQSLFGILGTPVALAEDARIQDRSKQRTGEVWMEVKYDPQFPRAYRHSSTAQPLHTDGSYIPSFPNSSMLCCVKNAVAGGETVFIDGDTVAEIMETEMPDLFRFLVDNDMPHERSGDRRVEPVFSRRSSGWYLNWNYYCVADGGDTTLRTMADQLHHYLLQSAAIKRHIEDVKLQPGEAVLWKDRELLHGRNAFEAQQEGERFIWKCAFDVGRLG